MINATSNVPKTNQPKPVPLVTLKKTSKFPQFKTPLKTHVGSKKSRTYLIAGIILFVLLIGGVVSYFLAQSSQEIRHQASTGNNAPGCGTACTSVTQCPSGFTCTAGKCSAPSCPAAAAAPLTCSNGSTYTFATPAHFALTPGASLAGGRLSLQIPANSTGTSVNATTDQSFTGDVQLDAHIANFTTTPTTGVSNGAQLELSSGSGVYVIIQGSTDSHGKHHADLAYADGTGSAHSQWTLINSITISQVTDITLRLIRSSNTVYGYVKVGTGNFQLVGWSTTPTVATSTTPVTAIAQLFSAQSSTASTVAYDSFTISCPTQAALPLVCSGASASTFSSPAQFVLTPGASLAGGKLSLQVPANSTGRGASASVNKILGGDFQVDTHLVNLVKNPTLSRPTENGAQRNLGDPNNTGTDFRLVTLAVVTTGLGNHTVKFYGNENNTNPFQFSTDIFTNSADITLRLVRSSDTLSGYVKVGNGQFQLLGSSGAGALAKSSSGVFVQEQLYSNQSTVTSTAAFDSFAISCPTSGQGTACHTISFSSAAAVTAAATSATTAPATTAPAATAAPTSNPTNAPTSYSCNQSCSSDSQCQSVNSNTVCYQDVCRLATNVSDAGCQPPPTSAPPVGCNQQCGTNADCAANGYICVNTNQGLRCRINTNISDDHCGPAAATPSPTPFTATSGTDTTGTIGTTSRTSRSARTTTAKTLPVSGNTDTTFEFVGIGTGAVIIGVLG